MKRIMLVVSIVALYSMSVLAQPPHQKGERKNHPEQKGGKGKHEKLAEVLELSESQQITIKDIKFESMSSMKAVKNELGEKEAKLKTLTSANKPDSKAIRALAINIGTLRSDLFVNKVETAQKIRSILDDRQKLKFDMMKDQRRRKGHKM